MSVSLPDVNVLVALFDPGHVNHDAAHKWFGSGGSRKWASCAITVNGCVRVLSRPGYPSARPLAPSEAADLVRELCGGAGHETWAADISILDTTRFRLKAVQGHNELTDLFLLGLAVRHGGELVTFDRSIPLRAVASAKEHHLCVL